MKKFRMNRLTYFLSYMNMNIFDDNDANQIYSISEILPCYIIICILYIYIFIYNIFPLEDDFYRIIHKHPGQYHRLLCHIIINKTHLSKTHYH